MNSIPLIYPMHLSVEQKSELMYICSELSTILDQYQSICLECPVLNQVSLISVIHEISSSVHNSHFKSFKFASYNIRISMIKLCFILDRSSELVSISSSVIDRLLITAIAQINTIIYDTYNLYLDSM